MKLEMLTKILKFLNNKIKHSPAAAYDVSKQISRVGYLWLLITLYLLLFLQHSENSKTSTLSTQRDQNS